MLMLRRMQNNLGEMITWVVLLVLYLATLPLGTWLGMQ